MNSHLRVRSSISVIVIATILLAACAKPASTPTLEPTSTPKPTSIIKLLSQSPELILAINKPLRPTTWPYHVVYSMAGTGKVLLASELIYYDGLTVDIYYPPGYNFEAKLPIVILARGFQETDEFDKDMASQIDWAKLIAASGMIAVSAQAGTAPTTNSYHVLEFLAANADLLGIDLTRIGFWACSSGGGPVFEALGDKELPYRDGFRAAVFLYLDLSTAAPSCWPQSLSLFVVKAGGDENINSSIMDNFVSQARSSNISTQYIELAGAPHAFDIRFNTQEAKDVIQQALEFFKSKLLK
jgi:dienelactone hydrolase